MTTPVDCEVVTETESTVEDDVGKAWEVVAKAASASAVKEKELTAKVSAMEASLDDESATRNKDVAALRKEISQSVESARREFAASLEAALDSERAARTALARRVAELTRDFAEARAQDARRIADLEQKLFDAQNYDDDFHYYRYDYDGQYAPKPRHSWGDSPHGNPKYAKKSKKDNFFPQTTPPTSESASPGGEHEKNGFEPTTKDVAPEALRELEDQILILCDQSSTGSILCANLPRLYYYRFRKALDFRGLGFMKMSQLLSKMDRVNFDGKHRAEVSRRKHVVTPGSSDLENDGFSPRHDPEDPDIEDDKPPPPAIEKRILKKPVAPPPPSDEDNGAPPPPPPPPEDMDPANKDSAAPSWSAIVTGGQNKSPTKELPR